MGLLWLHGGGGVVVVGGSWWQGLHEKRGE